jgi:hypothetical protein
MYVRGVQGSGSSGVGRLQAAASLGLLQIASTPEDPLLFPAAVAVAAAAAQ